MPAIAPPLKPDGSGDQVANLQAALLFLLDRDALTSFYPPKNPGADEPKTQTESLRTEQAGQTFGPATQQLLPYLQLQEGPGSFLNGNVEETTAQRLNEWLVQLGAFYLAQGRVSEVLVMQFKLQSGLGDEGIVDEKTADALNALLKKFGAFGSGTDFVVRGTVKTHASALKAALSSSPSTAICAVGRNWGAPRPTQRASSRSRIDTSPFAKQRA